VKLGLVFLWAILPLTLLACAAKAPVTQTLLDQQMEYLTAPAATPAPKQAHAKAPKPQGQKDPLEICAVVPEDNLQEMRGTLGVYFFDYNFDINLVTNPQVSVTTNFSAAVPNGSPAPSFNGSTATFQDNNVSYVAGPTSGGLMSQVMVTGRDNIVFANTQFNIRLPDTSQLIPNVNALPASSLTGIGVK
jgi:hypothetical protein